MGPRILLLEKKPGENHVPGQGDRSRGRIDREKKFGGDHGKGDTDQEGGGEARLEDDGGENHLYIEGRRFGKDGGDREDT